MTVLVMALFGGARAVSMEFSNAPSTIAGPTSFVLEIGIPENTRVPIESITAIIEQQAPDANDKRGATLVTRATCPLVGNPSNTCAGPSLAGTGSRSEAIAQIDFQGFFAATTDTVIASGDAYSPGLLTGTTTGYGYDTSFGYGYGYLLGAPTSFNAGTGYGYGLSDVDLVLRFSVLVHANQLALDTHYLTMLADTGSPVIGILSSPFAQFDVVSPGGGGGNGNTGTPPGPGGGGAPSGPPPAVTVQAEPLTPQPGATASFQTPPVTVQAGQQVIVTTNDPGIPEITFVPSEGLNDATIQVSRFDTSPPGTGPLPSGVGSGGFVQITVTSGGTSHSITIAVSIPESDATGNPDQAVLLKYDPGSGEWVPKSRIQLALENGFFVGTGSSDCCSDYAVAFDTEPPTLTVAYPDAVVTQPTLITAQATDNLAISRVEFYVDDALVVSQGSEPYQWLIDPQLLEPGAHEVRVIAYDFVDNSESDRRAISTDQSLAAAGNAAGAPWVLTASLVVLALGGSAATGYALYRRQKDKKGQ